MLTARQIALKLSPAETAELNRLDLGLRTNKAMRHDPAAVASLINQGLAIADGTAVKITSLGYDVLRLL